MNMPSFIPPELRATVKNTADIVKTTLQGHKVTRLTNFNCCPRPVLLIYGFGTTRRVFSVMEKRLRRDGFDVFSINMGGVFDIVRTGDITYRAKLVADKVETLYKKYDLGPLTVIGHSEGGIIGRYYVQCLGGEKHVRSLITLGSPHQGTPAAIAGAAVIGFVARNLFQLMPGSAVLKKLAGKPFPAGVEFHSIYSADDWVCPPSACRAVDAQGAEIGTNVEMKGFGHNDFLMRKEPYKMIRKLLFKIPEGASCMEDQGARAASAG